MAGSKRQKLKKKAADMYEAISPSQSPVSATEADEGLLDDLLAQMNQSDGQPNPEAAKVLSETTSIQKSTESLSSKLRKDPRARWKERQVRHFAHKGLMLKLIHFGYLKRPGKRRRWQRIRLLMIPQRPLRLNERRRKRSGRSRRFAISWVWRCTR